MKEIKLTQGKFAMVDDVDYEWLSQWKWYAAKFSNTFYAWRGVNVNRKVKIIQMHRLILGLTDTQTHTDHIDGNGLNNQRLNIRACSRSENMRNKKPNRRSASIFKGVHWHKPNRKWVAQIGVNSKARYIGSFDSEIEAAMAYNEAALKHFGEFARLNQISADV